MLQPDTVPQLDAALHGDPIAYHDVVLHEHSVTDVAVGADDRTRKHVRERPDARSRADLGGFAERVGMDVGHAEGPEPRFTDRAEVTVTILSMPGQWETRWRA